MSMQTKTARFSSAYEMVAAATATLDFNDRNLALSAVAKAGGMTHSFDNHGFWLSWAGRPLFCVFR